ncbi:MAG: hypothetical protein VXY27_01540, partial [Thermoproteota archaeon]|nr:hypothetical protein [Thermoproteota archaeon]
REKRQTEISLAIINEMNVLSKENNSKFILLILKDFGDRRKKAYNEFLKKNDAFDKSQTIDDLVGDFKKIEDDGLVRCIAQNFTTQWFKIFDDVEKIPCTSCNTDAYLGKEESRICPNSDCNATL